MSKSIVYIFLFLVLSSCYYDKKEELYPEPKFCDTFNISFSGKVAPILNQHCALQGCHATGSATGGYMLDTYNGTKLAVNNNRLIGSIKWDIGFSNMPRNNAKLSDCDIKIIEIWVSQGALNN